VAAVPKGYRTVTPHLVCRGTADAIQFYVRAFGAKEKLRMAAPDGSIAHAELQLGDSMVMLGEESPQQGALSPQAIGGTPVNVFLYVADVDRSFARAVEAGATALMPPTNMFWGDRYAQLSDPFGHKWSMATHIEDVSPKEMGRRMNEFYAQGGPPA
jgi:PhnB protein